MLQSHLRWHGDWYAMEEIAPGVFAIEEPKYHQINWNYLICGSDRAVDGRGFFVSRDVTRQNGAPLR
jgi:hypothetical protein